MDGTLSNTPRLQVQNVGMRFGKQVLFKGLSFEGMGGESLAITGSNGSGKTTLLHLIAGLQSPVAGKVLYQEGVQAFTSVERPLAVGMIAPYINLYEPFSLAENLAFIAKVRGIALGNEQINSLGALVQLEAHMNRPIQKFSSGMKQRARYAMAILPNPNTILIDEPTTNLDEKGRKMVWEFVDKWLSEGKLVIVATNEESEAERCQKIIQLS